MEGIEWQIRRPPKLLKSRAFAKHEGRERKRERGLSSFPRIFARRIRPRMQIRPMYSSVYFNIRSTLEGGLELTRVSTFFFFSKLLTGFNALTAGCYGWTGLLADLIFGWKVIVQVSRFYPFPLEKQLLLHGKLVLYVENMGQDSLDGLRRD